MVGFEGDSSIFHSTLMSPPPPWAGGIEKRYSVTGGVHRMTRNGRVTMDRCDDMTVSPSNLR